HDLVGQDVALAAAGGKASEGADLEDAAVAFEGINDGAALGDEAGHGLFAQHVLAGLGSGDEMRACQCGGVARATKSMSLRSRTRRKSLYIVLLSALSRNLTSHRASCLTLRSRHIRL